MSGAYVFFSDYDGGRILSDRDHGNLSGGTAGRRYSRACGTCICGVKDDRSYEWEEDDLRSDKTSEKMHFMGNAYDRGGSGGDQSDPESYRTCSGRGKKYRNHKNAEYDPGTWSGSQWCCRNVSWVGGRDQKWDWNSGTDLFAADLYWTSCKNAAVVPLLPVDRRCNTADY